MFLKGAINRWLKENLFIKRFIHRLTGRGGSERAIGSDLGKALFFQKVLFLALPAFFFQGFSFIGFCFAF